MMELGTTSHGLETTFQMELPSNGLGITVWRDWEYTLSHPGVRASVLVSQWRNQRKLVGCRLSGDRKWHVAAESNY